MHSLYNHSKATSNSRITCRSCGKNYLKSKVLSSDIQTLQRSIQKYGSQYYFKMQPQLDQFDQYMLKRDRKNNKKIHQLTKQIKYLKSRLLNCQNYIHQVSDQNKSLQKSLQHFTKFQSKSSNKQTKNQDYFNQNSISIRNKSKLNQQISKKLRKLDLQEEKEKQIKLLKKSSKKQKTQGSIYDTNFNMQKYLPISHLHNLPSSHLTNKKSQLSNGNELLKNMYYDGNQYQLVTPNQKYKNQSKFKGLQESFYRQQKTLKYSNTVTPSQFNKNIDKWTDDLDQLILQQSKASTNQQKSNIKQKIFQISEKIRIFQQQNNFDRPNQNDDQQYY